MKDYYLPIKDKPKLKSIKMYLFMLLFNVGLFGTWAQHAPSASNDYNSTSFNTTLTVAAPGVLGNDSDADGDPITVSRFVVNGTSTNAGNTYTIAGVGDITINADGSYTFVPVAGYSGSVPTITYYIQDDENPVRTDSATLRLYVEDNTPNLGISISSCNQGFIQPNSTDPGGNILPNGAYKIRYYVSISNNSNAYGYNSSSQITNIEFFNDLEQYFGDGTILYIDIENVTTSWTNDGTGSSYPRDWDMSDIDTNEFSASDATPGRENIFTASATANNVLYPRQSIGITYCLYVSPDYAGDANVIARSYPDPSGSGIDFDNTVNATSSNGNDTADVEIKDFHTTDAFVAADLYIQPFPAGHSSYVPNYDGTYDVTNIVTIVNDGTQPAQNVNFNYALGNWIDDGITLQSVNLVLGAGSAAVTLNPNFDGDANSYLLDANQTLNAGEKVVVEIHQTFNPTDYSNANYFTTINPSMTLGAADGYDETAPATKRSVSFVTWSDAQGSHVDRYLNSGSLNPTPSSDSQCECDGGYMRFSHEIETYITKEIHTNNPAASGIPGNRDIVFRIKFGVDAANSTVRLENVKLTDDLNGICAGNIVNVDTPQIVYSTAEQDPNINPAYNGIGDINVFDGSSGIVNPGEEIWVDIKVEISDTCEGDNTASLDGNDPEGHTASSHPQIGGTDSVTVSVLTPIVAQDDTGSINGSVGGTAITSVLNDNGNGNDTLDNANATAADVVISPVGALPAGIHLDTNTGEVTVDPGTPAGNYTFNYQICQATNTDNCDTATVTLNITSTTINAEDDDFVSNPVNGVTGGVAGNVFADNGNGTDTVNGNPANDANTVTPVVVAGPNTTLNGATIDPNGDIHVPAGTPAGVYTVEYQVCADEAPTVCDTAVATIFVDGDNDGDGIIDSVDIDDDNDGITDCEEEGLSSGVNGAFATNGSASVVGATEVQLTPATNNNIGTLFSFGKVDFSKPFDITFEVNLGNNNGGADGMSIVFHNDPAGSNAIGSGGAVFGAETIQNGIVLEIDTYDNGAATYNDINNDHTMLWDSDDIQTVLSSPVDFGNLEDGNWHQVNIRWNSVTQTIIYTLDGVQAAAFTGDLVTNYFNNSNLVYFGLTAATGGANNDQRVRFADLCNLPLLNDADGDGIPNSYDLDSDNDGIPDVVEAGGTDTDGDGIVDGFTDNNGDGMDDNTFNNPLPNPDTDGDGINDVVDLDSDNDGIPDIVEAGGTDANGDGVVDSYTDSDGDGFDDHEDTTEGGTAYPDPDTDGDGIIGTGPINDPDGDGFSNITDTTEGGTALDNPDTDHDGIPDNLDIDSDNDGITDVYEAGGTDADGDGRIDGYTDNDGDGFNDGQDTTQGGTNLPQTDTDGDGHPDYLDIDADNDGIPDNIEAQGTDEYLPPTGIDSDGDGLDNRYDPDNAANILTDPEDTDGDNTPDYLDLDSDNDGRSDAIEGWDTNDDGVADTLPTGNDADNDGLDDAYDTVDNTTAENNGTNNTNPTSYPDNNNPGGDRDWRQVLANPDLTITKTAQPVSPTATVGDVVTYTLVVTNVGNVTLENIQVTDSNATPSSLSAGTLSPGSSTTLTVTHTITQSDMNNGTFTNVATASTTFNGNSVTAVSDDPNDVTDQDIDGDGHPDDPTVVDLTPNQVISIEAELDDQVNSTSGSPAVLNAGDTFTYILNVENTGNVDITPDTPAGYTYLSGDDNGDGVMNPGEVWSYGMEHTVTQSEVDSGQIAAQVTVTGTDATPSAGSVSDMSDDPYDYDNHDHEGDGEPDDETVTYIKQNPELTVTKQDHIPAGATVGDDVSYTIVVTNSGNVTLTNINVSDANATITSGTPIATLSPGSSATVTAVHTITQADMDNGGFDNVAVASSNFNGNNVEDSSDDPDTLTPDDPTHTDLTPYQVVQIEAELTDNIAGTPANDQALTTSDNINYTLTVTNPGNTSIIPSIDPSYTYTGGDTDGDGELDPGEVWTYTQTVPVTQADIDSGSIVAQTNVTGTGVNGTPAQDLSDDPEEAAGTDDPTVTGIIQTPELTVTKDDNIPTDASIGDVITYTIVVTNSGNVTLHDIVLTDSNAVISGNNTIATLSPGSFVTFTATHTITLSDMNNGSVSNSAVATGKDPQDNGVTDTSDDSNGLQPGGDDPTISDLTPYQQAELTAVLDDNDPSGPTNPSTYYEGDHINYDLFVENTGNVSIVPDTPLGYTPVTSGGVNVGDTNGDGLQDPGEVWQYTASHTLTQAEIDAGVYSTQVSVSGSFNGTTVTDNASDDPQTNADNDPTNTYFNLISEISITKVDQLPLFVMVGQDITYTITVNNNGNTTLSNVVVTDDNAVNITYTGGDTNGNNMLEPSETWTYTATHTITQSDMDAGAVANTAAVTSHNPQGDPVEDLQSDDTDTAEPNDPTVSDLHTYQNPAITTIKVVSNYIDNLPVGNTAGDVIEYDISVQNTGNITISNLQVIDLMVTNSGGTVTYTSGDTDGDNLLDVDETWHYTAVYTVTQSDIDSGEVENTAVGYGIDSNGTPLSDVSDSDPLVGTPEDPTVTTFVQEPRLEVTKQDVLPVQVSVGEYITYTIVVTNTGNVTLDNISVSDSNAVMNGVGSTPSLAPGDSVTFTAVHQITQEDMDSGMVSNQATATAEDTNGNTISDLSDDPDDNTDLDSEGDGDPDDITITDLTPYQVSSMASTLDDNVQTNANNPYNYNVGDDIVYTATLTNTGNVSITPVTPSGYTPVEQGGVNVGDTDGDGVLDPGETWIYTTTHTVTQSDIDAGHVDNQVTFEGTSATGSQVSDVSDDPQDMTTTTDDVTVTYIGQVSELTVIKTGVFSGSTPAAVGDVITYTITVTNTGNQTLTDIQVSDPNAVVTLPSVQVDLLPGESYDFTAIHTLTQSDIDAGMVENQATATGMDPSNQQVSDLSDDPSTGTPEDPTVISVPVHSELIITKTGIFDDSQQYGGNGDNYAQPGEYIVYTFEVINAGNQTISNITIDDSNLWAQGVSYTGGDINGNHLLDVGEVWTYSGIHVLTQSDIDAGMIENQATVNGEDPQGNTLTDLSDDPHDSTNDDSEGDGEPDDVTLTEVPQHPELSILKSGHFNDENGNGLADIGETISYTFVVSNIGNVTLHGVYVEDDLAGVEISGTPIILAPGESDNTTFTGVYVITASDIDNGFVVNTATVSGLTPQGVSVTDISDDPSNMNDVDSEGDGEPDDPTVIETLGLVITTIFTPNDDQTNDKWEIKGIQNFPHNQVKIYNRWGNLVYEKAHYMSDWDGYSNGRMVMESGKKLPVGTYYYIIDLGNGHEAFTGYLYLNR